MKQFYFSCGYDCSKQKTKMNYRELKTARSYDASATACL